jgi:hypothetical protein
LVQGEVDGTFPSDTNGDIEIFLDQTVKELHQEKIYLDFVPSQGFKLYTDSEYLSTHLRLYSDIAEI